MCVGRLTAWSPEQLWEQTIAATAHIRKEYDAWQSGLPPTGRGPAPKLTTDDEKSGGTVFTGGAAASANAPAAAAVAATASAAISACELPVIDLRRFLHGSASERHAVAAE